MNTRNPAAGHVTSLTRPVLSMYEVRHRVRGEWEEARVNQPSSVLLGMYLRITNVSRNVDRDFCTNLALPFSN